MLISPIQITATKIIPELSMPFTISVSEIKMTSMVIAKASTTVFEDIPQIVSKGYFLWLDNSHILLDSGTSIVFAETN